MKRFSAWSRETIDALLLAAAIVALYLVSLRNYLLFHSLVESFTVIIAAGVFIIVWNARRFLHNNYLFFLGIAFFFVGGLDLLHLLAYKGMGVFPRGGADLPTQLWIAARLFQAAALVAAPFFLGRGFRPRAALAVCAAVFAAVILTIFVWNVFPTCYVDTLPRGRQTPFKLDAEIVVIALFAVAGGMLWRRRRYFERDSLLLLLAAIAASIAGEAAFMCYRGVYEPVNMVGHLFKVIAFYLLYKAVVESSFVRPYEVLFNHLKLRDEELRVERDRAQTYLDVAGAIIVIIGPDHKVKMINRAGCEILDAEPADVIGRDWFAQFLPERVRGEVRRVFDDVVAGRVELPEHYENPVLTRSGDERLIAWNNSVLTDENWNITGMVCAGEDITERRWAEEELREREYRLRAVFEASLDAMVVYDDEGVVVQANPAAAELFGLAVNELTGRSLRDFFERGIDFERLLRAQAGKDRGDVRIVRPDGRRLEAGYSAAGGFLPGRHLAVLRDISERKKQEEALAHLATHDPLTDLANRALFNDHLHLALMRARRNRQNVGVLLLDLDNFKDVNDTLGHRIGDQLLRAVADRLRSLVRKSDTVARLGGDEFLVLLSEIANAAVAAGVAEKILAAIHRDFACEDHPIRCTTSIGVAIFPDDGEDSDTLIKNADIAMYQAKRAGRDGYRRCQRPAPTQD